MVKHPTPEPQPGSGSNRPDEPYPTPAADPGVQPQHQPDPAAQVEPAEHFAHVDSFIPRQHVDDSNMPPPDPRDTLYGSKIHVAPEDEPRAAAQARAAAGAVLEPGDAELLGTPTGPTGPTGPADQVTLAEQQDEEEYEYDDSDEDEDEEDTEGEPDKPKTKKKKKK